jgi:protein SCO1/2
MTTFVQRTLIPQLVRAFAGWAFPAFVVSVLLEGALCAALIVVVPLQGTTLERFTQDFKVWCFGYDPARGTMVWAMVASFTVAPLMLASFVMLVFWEPLHAALRRGPIRMWPAPLAALATLSIASGGLLWTSATQAAASLAFPAEDLRTSLPAPSFTLTDQTGRSISSESMRGHIVLVTGVYSSCSTTCPMIMSQVRAAMHELTQHERQDVRVLAITLDPERDDPARLAEVAKARGLDPDTYHLLTGDTADVARVLDGFSIARSRDPATGVIEHANMFILLDRAGTIAYRLSLGPARGSWLRDALRALLQEPHGA